MDAGEEAHPICYRPITTAETLGLRHAILHPDQPPDALRRDSDDASEALHTGAFCGERLIGVGSVWPAALPESRYTTAWRVVGMAVEPGWRGRGIGSFILGRLLAHAANQGGRLAWCNARPEAETLYRRYGFTSTPGPSCPNAPRMRMTSRLDRSAPAGRGVTEREDGIRRIDAFPRLSRAVVHNGTVHIGGLLANRADVTVAEQTREILEQIDTLLLRAGTTRSRLVSAMVWLKDIATVGEANAVWEAWVPPGSAPVRACVQAVPGSPEYAVEIAVMAAL